MIVRIKRLDQTLPLPEYHTDGAAAFDLYSREDTVIAPREIKLLPSNLIIEVPAGHFLMIAPRSSTAKKKSLIIPNSPGVIDADYHGPDDEIHIQVYNFSDAPVEVKRGERIAQGIIMPIVRAEWEEVSEINAPNRGGFGSTGGYHEGDKLS
ncbi:MAG: dUTP pyrophosphatase [Candidatus Magasanikbacteria bacterium]|nr:dUTP pyrophosphatase [Candidatus Magasanikbacteria bacterium]